MAFGNTSSTSSAFTCTRSYGCGLPVAGEAEALQEMERRVRLWNRYVEIERAFDATVEDGVAALDPPFAAALAAYRGAVAARKAAEYGAITAAKEALIAARAAYKAALTVARTTHRDALTEVKRQAESVRQAAVRALRANNECYWANSNDVLLAYQAARVAARKKGGTLHFQRWTGEGKLTVQFPVPLPVGDLFAGTNLSLQVEARETARAWAPGATRSEQRHLARTVARLRVRSTQEPGRRNTPVWVELPVTVHRPIPDGTIQNASIQRRAVGTRWRWSLVITVRTAAPAPEPTVQTGAAAVDLGWRTLFDAQGAPAGLRVAVARGSDGQIAELDLSQRWLDGLRQSDALRRVRDEHAEALRAALRAWRAQMAKKGGLPEWFAARTAPTARVWRSNEALERLAWDWRFSRCEGDTALFELADAWRTKEVHLSDWQTHQQNQLLSRRREWYRQFAKGLTERYREIRLENLDLRPLVQTRPTTTQGDPQDAGAHGQSHLIRWHRFAAAVSTLVQAIESAARTRGVTVTRIKAVNSTRECHVCGHIEAFNAKRSLTHTCGACGASWDQDVNAATVLLLREPGAAQIAPGVPGPLPVAGTPQLTVVG